MQIVKSTYSGHFYKLIPDFGMLIYSPYNSLTYAIPEAYMEDTISYLNGSKMKLPKEIKSPLIQGWKKQKTIPHFSTNHLLPVELNPPFGGQPKPKLLIVCKLMSCLINKYE